MKTFLASAIGSLILASTAQAAVIELQPVDDTQIVYGVGFYADETDRNFGATTAMAASTSRIAFDWDRISRSLLKFELTGLSPTDTINSVTLILTQAGYTSNPLTLELLHLGDDSWHEADVTWSTGPTLASATLLATREWAPGDTVNWTSWTVPAAGEWDWGPDLADGFVSFVLKVANDTTTTPNRGVSWMTKESGGLSSPLLLIDYTPVPLPAALPLLAGMVIPLLGWNVSRNR